MSGGIWRPASPASDTHLAVLREQASVRLPAAYLAQLAISNGGEGELGVAPGWIVLWPAEDVMSMNARYSVATALPGFVGFGSNCGGELLAFDLRDGEPYPIVMVPFIPMDPEEAVRIARSFDDLRELIGKPAAA